MTTEQLQLILQSENEITLSEIKQIIYELKNDCIGANDVTNAYQSGYFNGEVNAFYICLDLLDKLDVSKDSLEKRLIKLEEWQKRTHIQNKVMSLFTNMQYGKLSSKEVDMAYYKMKLNEIFGNDYTDTDSIKQDEAVSTIIPNLACSKCERDVIICKEEGRCMKEYSNG